MRLGLRPTVFDSDTESWSKVRRLYGGVDKIWERHRHRYEVNPDFIKPLTESGLRFVGKDERGERMQILELPGASILFVQAFSKVADERPHFLRRITDHPYFVGLQAHPEFCTRPLNPSPPFLGFIAAASSMTVLQSQIELQLKTFKPPHPVHAMVSEAELRHEEPIAPGKEVAMANDQ